MPNSGIKLQESDSTEQIPGIKCSVTPVLLLTGRELFGQYRIESPYDIYGDKKEMAERVYRRNDIQDTCDFTQQLYLGIESYYTWREKKRQKLIARRAAKKKATE